MDVGLMTEDELLRHAREAMEHAKSLPIGSLGRVVQWGVYDTYESELRRRAIMLGLPVPVPSRDVT
jgi:hypothetical protein